MEYLGRPNDRGAFEIAIICALQIERDAIEALFDDEYETDGFSYGKSPGDHNAYTIGRIGRHHVILAYMPGMGKVSSAAVASGIASSFRGIKVCFLVGICGGAPKTAEDDEILLGDVIISESVVQLDFGRQYPNGFKAKVTLGDTLGRANPSIRAFIGKASGRLVRQRLSQKTALNAANILKITDFRRYSYPGLKNDRLYQAEYRHKHQVSGACSICDKCQNEHDDVCAVALKASCKDLGCDERHLLSRALTNADSRMMKIHFGRMASADTVMKSGAHRDRIIAEHEVIAFEMEAAGAWDYLPTIVIKSVCDYADSHKNKIWQGYAAVAAAACTKGLLDEWRGEDKPYSEPPVTQPQRVLWSPDFHSDNGYANPMWDPMETTNTLLLHKPDSLFRRSPALSHSKEFHDLQKDFCLKFLSFRSIDSRRFNIASAHEGTCNWLFSKKKFQQWHSRERLDLHNGVLWITGKPGAGKSTLMKHTLLYLKNNCPVHKDNCPNRSSWYNHENSCLAIASYFFDARGDILDKTPLGMLRALTYQLLDQVPQLLDPFARLLSELQQKHGENVEWHPKILSEFLLEIFSRQIAMPIIILVDALDECNEDDVRFTVSFLESLSLAAVRSRISLSICLSSRHYPTIRMKKMLSLAMEEQIEHRNDISIYVRDNLRWRDQFIEKEIIRKASGVFIWVVLVVELLNQAFDQGRVRAMRETFQKTPDDLEDVFRNLLERDNDFKDQTVLMLQWVLFARRRLTPEELYFAVVSGTEPQDLELDRSNVTKDMITRFITSTSKGLVEIIQEGKGNERPKEFVQFIHETANDFLLRHRRLQLLDASIGPHIKAASHERLKTCCFTYLKAISSRKKRRGLRNNAGQLRLQYPFLEYSILHMYDHAEEAHHRGCRQHSFLQYLQHEHKFLKTLLFIYNTFVNRNNTNEARKYVSDVNLLYVAVSERHQTLSKCLLHDLKIDPNTKGGYYGNILQAVAALGYEIHALKMLLETGADVNAQGGYYGTALQATAAAASNHSNALEAVELLLTAGADTNIQAGYYGTALQAASTLPDFHGLPIVKRLLAAGADAKIQAGYCGNALQAAARHGCLEVARTLLRHGADPNAHGGEFGSAIQAAVYAPMEMLVLLINEGADVNQTGGRHGTALHAAVSFGTDRQIKTLLKAGAEPNIKAGTFGTALQAACIEGKFDVVPVLLVAGANPNVTGRWGTPLYAASQWFLRGARNAGTIQMLLVAGANVNVRFEQFKSVLQYVAGHTSAPMDLRVELARMLLDSGADHQDLDEELREALDQNDGNNVEYFPRRRNNLF